MIEKLSAVEGQYQELMARLGTAEVQSDPAEYRKAAKLLSDLEPLVAKFQEYKAVLKDIEGAEEMARGTDAEMREMAQDELKELGARRDVILEELKVLLIPKDPNDEKNVILEIRAGTGGDEAALFAADLFRMYSRYAESQGWRFDVVEEQVTDLGGLKELVARIEGEGVFARLKYESGVHRIQRVPATEASGRIHTSAATVAVLPEAEEVDVQIDPNDLRIDTMRASGAGGQHVNKTDSAVRITHLPTGIVVTSSLKSQHQNRDIAMQVLRARLYDLERARIDRARSADRRSQVGSGDRSERIRTYNVPQGRLTDHRIGLTLYRLDQILDGDLGEIIDTLTAHAQAEALAQMAE